MPRPFVLDDTFGALFIGVFLAAMLHGVSIVQACYYWTNRKDTWVIKSLVGAVMICDSIHQALITHTLYTYLITNWGSPEDLGRIVWSLILQVLFNGLTALLVQSFLTMRLYHFSAASNKNRWLTILVVLLVLAEFACTLAFTAIALPFDTFVQLKELETLSRVVNALTAAADVLITIALCAMLHFSRSGHQKSDTIINRLMLFSINTGLLTSLCAIASLVSITVAGDTFIYIAFYFCIGRLYTNCLLATLNARKMIRGSEDTTLDNLSFTFPKLSQNSSVHFKKRTGTDISIKIDTMKEFAPDHEDQDMKSARAVGEGKDLDTV